LNDEAVVRHDEPPKVWNGVDVPGVPVVKHFPGDIKGLPVTWACMDPVTGMCADPAVAGISADPTVAVVAGATDTAAVALAVGVAWITGTRTCWHGETKQPPRFRMGVGSDARLALSKGGGDDSGHVICGPQDAVTDAIVEAALVGLA